MRILIQFGREVIDFFYQLFAQRALILTLSTRSFKQQYIRNAFGFVWAVLDPLAFVVILYFVFSARFARNDHDAMPFIVYLFCGYVAYELFNSTLLSVTSSIHNHSFLLKKVNFKVAILPIVSGFSNLFMHGVVLTVLIAIFLLNGLSPSLFWFQIFYYIFALMCLLVSVGWLTASIYLFFPDIRNVINIISRILFFLTPIFWNMEGILPKHQFILKLNPVYYIANGYRDSFFYKVGFWEHPLLTIYFWLFTLIFLIAGVSVFKKLRPHFADVV
jgi:lipopolysaccharide transport system permease protein/teichoic acid transport system permease protein